MVYEYLADNLHHILYSRPQRKLEEVEVKRVTRVILKGLATMHKQNMAHTGTLSERVSLRVLDSSCSTEAGVQISNPTILSLI